MRGARGAAELLDRRGEHLVEVERGPDAGRHPQGRLVGGALARELVPRRARVARCDRQDPAEQDEHEHARHERDPVDGEAEDERRRGRADRAERRRERRLHGPEQERRQRGRPEERDREHVRVVQHALHRGDQERVDDERGAEHRGRAEPGRRGHVDDGDDERPREHELEPLDPPGRRHGQDDGEDDQCEDRRSRAHPAQEEPLRALRPHRRPARYHRSAMADESAPLEQQLEEIRTQLAWVRDYL